MGITSQTIIHNRYELREQVGAGGMGMVYKSYDRLTGETLALKRLSVAPNQLDFSTSADSVDIRLALAQEFRTLASLRHPNIISVLDYGFDDEGKSFFTMELLPNAQNLLETAQGKNQVERIDLLVQTLQALIYLHRRGIVHRDLKPDNVLVENNRLRVLDFGLALEQKTEQDVGGGTLLYMSPELLNGERASVASDLYAFGLMAYELFAGRLPFDHSITGRYIADTLMTPPDLTLLQTDEETIEIIGRLLEKKPEDRFPNAHSVLLALAQIHKSITLLENPDIRESFLQKAPFTGRELEFDGLSKALDSALEGNGSFWLIGGESGVGKSRLVDELRIHSLVRGALVLRGQAVSNGGQVYELWRGGLRQLILLADPTELEASILKPIIADIEQLLQRQIPDAAPLNAAATRSRLLSTIADLVKRIPQPMLFILEDLHWADQESLDLLAALSRQMQSLRVLLLGTFRIDEAKTLPNRFKNVNLLKMQRLDEAAIATLSSAMLGEAASNPQVIEMLQRETEGNIFFLIEAVRALAEEAGNIEQIATLNLPTSIITGGMKQVIQRRLSKVAQENYGFLQAAAVAGRRIDLALMAILINDERLFNYWLNDAADAAVIEFHELEWRFSHDKLREALVDGLSTEARQATHQKIAETTEQLYRESYPDVLFYHWGMAGNIEKEAYYGKIAGQVAFRTGANHDAIRYLSKAIAFRPAADLERMMGQAEYGLGNLAKGREHLLKALHLMGQKYPNNLILGLIKEILLYLLTLLGFPYRPRFSHDEILEAVRIYNWLGEITYFTSETILGVYCVLKMLNLARATDESPELANAYINMSVAMSFVPLHRLAEYYCEEAKRIAARQNDASTFMRVMNVAAVYYNSVGKWTLAEEALDTAQAVSKRTGDKREGIQTGTTRAITKHYQGRFEEAAELNLAADKAAGETGNKQQQGWGVYSRAENLNYLGAYAEAAQVLENVMEYIDSSIQKASHIRVYSVQANTWFHLGDTAHALERLEEAITLLGNSSPNVYSMMDAYAVMSGIYLDLAESAETEEERQNYLKLAEKRLFAIKGFARLYPIGKPRLHLWQGRIHALKGESEKAQKEYQAALEKAKALEMLYDIQLAERRLESGRHG